MKIVFTGGGSGGHFFPIIAVAESLTKLAYEEKYIKPKMYYFGPAKYDEELLFDNDISFRKVVAGKRRVGYGRIRNFLDMFVMGWGILQAIWRMYRVFPDVVFSKGSYTSFPVLVAARFFGIPVIVHESDSRPGRANKWAGKFAEKVAVSYEQAAEFFPEEKIAYTGNPVRQDITDLPTKDEGLSFFELDNDVPTILVTGASQGAQRINDVVLNVLPRMVKKYQIIHQTGPSNFEEIERTKEIILEYSEHKERYKPVAFLDANSLRHAAAASDLVITRAGSSLFEIALWGIPSIVVPISVSNGDHQRTNAYAYTHNGAGIVIEENNLTSNIVLSQINTIFSNDSIRKQMGEAALKFAKKNAADKIARALFDVGMKHQEK
ncbi:MAG: undecaprenyldiphospho-muramoylpentapeptide beta-N-acetylglucosaminyltransferase [Candidatus Campbellbacteria bacterium]|nr:undecaprenyldiphospho-muramoylpentapeptide beta-N-acetylglucosaminyltransferase [Candidatus Campbellbacteria bacterium]